MLASSSPSAGTGQKTFLEITEELRISSYHLGKVDFYLQHRLSWVLHNVFCQYVFIILIFASSKYNAV